MLLLSWPAPNKSKLEYVCLFMLSAYGTEMSQVDGERYYHAL